MKKNFVAYYFERLDHWTKELKKSGYTQEIFKKAQKDTKEWIKRLPNK